VFRQYFTRILSTMRMLRWPVRSQVRSRHSRTFVITSSCYSPAMRLSTTLLSPSSVIRRKPTIPILDQLVADARLLSRKRFALGSPDPDRIGVTGHSHGALMTANLIGHSELFRAGVATSGSYNKTLTAFGFQNERRSVWDARDVYLKVSPFFVADKLKTLCLLCMERKMRILVLHHCRRACFYEAVRGNGWHSSYGHSCRTSRIGIPHQSNEQLVYEMLSGLQICKNAAPRPASSVPTSFCAPTDGAPQRHDPCTSCR